jgi:hypothetical protein
MSNDKNEVEVLPALVEPDYADAAERIRFHLSRARVAADVALKHIIEAGWELAKQKQLLGYGQWCEWCKEKLDISQQTADKYIATFQKTVGAARAEQSIGLEKKLLKKELDIVTEGLEEKTVRQAMIEIGVIKPNAGHGGKREGAGRKPKDVAKELKAVAENETIIWAAARGALDTLWKIHENRDMFHRLSDEHLATVAGLLADLSKKANESLKGRVGK